MKYFPIYLNLKEKNILVIGTGHETEPKVLQFLEAGAQLILVSETRPDYINKFEVFKNFIFEQRAFKESDLNNIWLVISTLGNDERITNEYIYNTATSRNILCNVVDVTELCSFIFPAIVSQGDVSIAISTSGTSPALAQNLKKKISDLVGPEYGLLAVILGERRKELLEKIPHKIERSELFHRLVNSDAIELLRLNKSFEAEALISKIIEEELENILTTTDNEKTAHKSIY